MEGISVPANDAQFSSVLKEGSALIRCWMLTTIPPAIGSTRNGLFRNETQMGITDGRLQLNHDRPPLCQLLMYRFATSRSLINWPHPLLSHPIIYSEWTTSNWSGRTILFESFLLWIFPYIVEPGSMKRLTCLDEYLVFFLASHPTLDYCRSPFSTIVGKGLIITSSPSEKADHAPIFSRTSFSLKSHNFSWSSSSQAYEPSNDIIRERGKMRMSNFDNSRANDLTIVFQSAKEPYLAGSRSQSG
jgi:hypothetical protein